MKGRKVIVIDDKIPFIRGILEPYADVRYLAPSDIDRTAVHDADVLIVRTRTRCNADLLDGSRCRFIGTATIGYDHIDADYCRRQGIEWLNAPGCNAASVAQYITASLLRHAARRGIDLSSQSIGIVGVGHVGRQVETHCRRLGMQVLLNDPPRAEKEGNENFVALDEIADRCDYITFHTPLTREGNHPTYHLADSAFFAGLQRRPVIINAARGGVVDEQCLLDAYRNGTVSDMIIDCWEGEPHIAAELLQKAFIATPHIAGYSADGKANATRAMVAAVATRLGVAIDLSAIVPPAPARPLITLTGEDDDTARAVWATYDPMTDSAALKSRPDTFEQLRGNYPLRREFGAYTLTPPALARRFENWGFATSPAQPSL